MPSPLLLKSPNIVSVCYLVSFCLDLLKHMLENLSRINETQEVEVDNDKQERLTMTVEEAGEALGISRATAYALANAGKIPVIRISERRLVVPRARLLSLLAGQQAPQS